MGEYLFETTNEFDKSYRKYVKVNKKLKESIDNVIIELISNPFFPSLKMLRVSSRNYGLRYSSRVTGDIRIIWDFFEGKTVIIALTIGGHSGKHKVYTEN